MSGEDWDLKITHSGENTINPLRKLWENPYETKDKPLHLKSKVLLQVGDPTVFRNFLTHDNLFNAIREGLDRDKFSYDDSVGCPEARNAVAEYCSYMGDIKPSDVILANGCSMALEMSFLALANPGENILIPCPGFNYTLWLTGYGIEHKLYNLDPSKNWDIDLKHLESLIDEKTKAIVVNSPGNPCGNVFSKEHILEIIEIAEKHKLPIISDEVYEFVTFKGVNHQSFASLSKNVPVLVCSGLTKRFMVPGIRMGWLVINDRGDKLRETRRGLMNISSRNFVPNSTVQHALPGILKSIPQSFFADNNQRIEIHATKAFEILKTIPGLKPVKPKGSFYIMIEIEFDKFPSIPSSLDFMKQLAAEQNVHIYPGDCFYLPGFFRIVFTPPEEMLVEGCERIKEFCATHYREA